jgi:hypothetical protein
MSFIHLGHFPFCYKQVDPVLENQRYNDFYSFMGVSGVGSIYPVGISLEDAMALYWLLKEINWNFSSTATTSSSTYNSSGGTFILNKNPTISNFENILRYRVCEPPDYSHELSGFPIIKNETVEFSPFSCFFAPSLFVGDINFSRILEWNGFFYPSIFLVFWNYSVLYSSQKFIGGFNSSSSAGNVSLTINNNSYTIPMFSIRNYTEPSISVNFNNIECVLHER